MTAIDEDTIITQDLHIDGNRIRVAIRKGDTESRLPMFVFNGLGGSWELLMSVFNNLDPAIEVITFDMIGAGASSTPLLPYTFKKAARLSRKILDRLGYYRINLMGISWGGALAQQFACLYPNICEKVILMATTPGVIMMPARPSILAKVLTPLRYWSPRYMQWMAKSVYGGEARYNKEVAIELAKKVKPNNIWGYYLQIGAIYRFTSLPWLHKLTMPILVMTGNDDPLIPHFNSKIIASRLPNAKLMIFEGAGHLFLLTKQEEVLPEIDSFFYGNR